MRHKFPLDEGGRSEVEVGWSHICGEERRFMRDEYNEEVR